MINFDNFLFKIYLKRFCSIFLRFVYIHLFFLTTKSFSIFLILSLYLLFIPSYFFLYSSYLLPFFFYIFFALFLLYNYLIVLKYLYHVTIQNNLSKFPQSFYFQFFQQFQLQIINSFRYIFYYLYFDGISNLSNFFSCII